MAEWQKSRGKYQLLVEIFDIYRGNMVPNKHKGWVSGCEWVCLWGEIDRGVGIGEFEWEI